MDLANAYQQSRDLTTTVCRPRSGHSYVLREPGGETSATSPDGLQSRPRAHGGGPSSRELGEKAKGAVERDVRGK